MDDEDDGGGLRGLWVDDKGLDPIDGSALARIEADPFSMSGRIVEPGPRLRLGGGQTRGLGDGGDGRSQGQEGREDIAMSAQKKIAMVTSMA